LGFILNTLSNIFYKEKMSHRKSIFRDDIMKEISPIDKNTYSNKKFAKKVKKSPELEENFLERKKEDLKPEEREFLQLKREGKV